MRRPESIRLQDERSTHSAGARIRVAPLTNRRSQRTHESVLSRFQPRFALDPKSAANERLFSLRRQPNLTKRSSTHALQLVLRGKREYYRAHRVRGPGESRSGSCSSDGSERGHALLAGCHERKETAPSYGNSGHVSADAQPKADPSDLEFRLGALQNLGRHYLAVFKQTVRNDAFFDLTYTGSKASGYSMGEFKKSR